MENDFFDADAHEPAPFEDDAYEATYTRESDAEWAIREREEDGWPSSNYICCPHHGHVISNGVFDAPCPGCESDAEEAGRAYEAEQAEDERHAREGSPCSKGELCAPFPWHSGPAADCMMKTFECTGDEIPF